MRWWFGGSLSDWTFAPVSLAGVDDADDLAQLVGGVEVTFWNAEVGGTRYTDLLDVDGVPITSVFSSDGGDGREVGTIPPFQGPEDVTRMWAQAGDGPRALIMATDVGDMAAAAIAQAEAAEQLASAMSADLETVKQTGYVLLLHNGSGYPPKPPGFAHAIRIGPTPPSSDVAEGDIWLQPEE